MDLVFFVVERSGEQKKQVRLLQHRQHPHRRPENKVLGGQDIMGPRLDAVRSWSNFFRSRLRAINFPREKQGGPMGWGGRVGGGGS